MIKVEKEPKEITEQFRGDLENCLFCGEETLYWHLETNTPVCVDCAKKTSVCLLRKAKKEKREKKFD